MPPSSSERRLAIALHCSVFLGDDLPPAGGSAPDGAGAIVLQDFADFSMAATGGAKKNRRAFFQLMRKHAIDAASFKS